MVSEILQRLGAWSELNTAITVTAVMAALSCALPGAWLVLRRQSMLGDALAHSALPGVVAAFLVAYGIQSAGWVPPGQFDLLLQLCIVTGAALAGLLTAWLTEMIRKVGRLENGAALGVVFTGLFAIGLVMMRVSADNVHLDPDCALFGVLEASAGDTLVSVPWLSRSAVANGVVLLVNLALSVVFFKELRIATFDPGLSNTLGIPAGIVQYLILTATAIAAATAFSTVGSILVIGLLVIPAAIAQLLTQSLWKLIALSLFFSVVMAVVGHAVAWSVPAPLFSQLGFPQVRDVSTAGMIAVVGGLMFGVAILIAPRTGMVTQLVDRFRGICEISADDLLANLYRQEEARQQGAAWKSVARITGWPATVARWSLKRRSMILQDDVGEWGLTPKGREQAQNLVRTHRLWESYLDQNYTLSASQLHKAADRVEHYIDPDTREAIAAELPASIKDPHGRSIPETPAS